VTKAEEGRRRQRYRRVGAKQPLIRWFPNGATPVVVTRQTTCSARGGYPGNWNILVPGGRESNSDSVSSGERNRNSLNLPCV